MTCLSVFLREFQSLMDCVFLYCGFVISMGARAVSMGARAQLPELSDSQVLALRMMAEAESLTPRWRLEMVMQVLPARERFRILFGDELPNVTVRGRSDAEAFRSAVREQQDDGASAIDGTPSVTNDQHGVNRIEVHEKIENPQSTAEDARPITESRVSDGDGLSYVDPPRDPFANPTSDKSLEEPTQLKSLTEPTQLKSLKEQVFERFNAAQVVDGFLMKHEVLVTHAVLMKHEVLVMRAVFMKHEVLKRRAVFKEHGVLKIPECSVVLKISGAIPYRFSVTPSRTPMLDWGEDWLASSSSRQLNAFSFHVCAMPESIYHAVSCALCTYVSCTIFGSSWMLVSVLHSLSSSWVLREEAKTGGDSQDFFEDGISSTRRRQPGFHCWLT